MIEALSIFNYSFMVGDAAVTALKQSQLKPVTKTFDCALFCCKALRKWPEHSRRGEKHLTTSQIST